MLGSVLSFSPDLADQVSKYCETHSEALPEILDKHWEWTIHNRFDSEMMSSKLQGQWMIWMAQWIAPKRVLEIGTYTGFSAVAWYDGTRATNAEIVTLDLPCESLEHARNYFKELAVDDRITAIAGPATETLKTIKGEFDLIFFDADKLNQENYLDYILKQRLLSPKGIILVDNILNLSVTNGSKVLARGITVGKDFNPYLEPQRRPFFENNGEALRKTNKAFLEDPRIDTVVLPLFDGITQIKWKEGYLDNIQD